MTRYYIGFKVFTVADYCSSECNAITFINNGTNNVILNNSMTLTPGQSLSINGNECEIDETKYLINFSSMTGSKCTVIQKYFQSC